MWDITQLCIEIIKADETQISAENDKTNDDTEHEDSVTGMDIFHKKFENDLMDVAEDPARWLIPLKAVDQPIIGKSLRSILHHRFTQKVRQFRGRCDGSPRLQTISPSSCQRP